MTIPDAKAWLNRSYRAEARIAVRLARIRQWQELAESITVTLKENAGGGSGGVSRLIESYAINIAEAKKELATEVQELRRLDTEIRAAIADCVEDNTLRAILELRYCTHMCWESVAVTMNMTTRWTLSLHQKALTVFAQNFEKKAL